MASVSNRQPVSELVTRAIQGYKQGDFIWNQILPVVNVGKENVKVPEFGKEHLKEYETDRPLKSDIQIADTDDWTWHDVELEEHSVGFEIDQREIENAQAVPNLYREYGRRVAQAIALGKEKAAADLVFSTSTITNNTTLSGTSQWSDFDDSSPINDILDAKSTVRGNVGIDPNTLVLGDAVFNQLMTNNQIIERLKYTGQLLTTDALAKMFGFSKVLVGKGVYWNGSAMTDLWGKHALVCYTTPSNTPQKDEPALGYTFQKSGYPKGMLYDASNSGKVKIAAASDYYKSAVLWSDAGYLIENAVA